MLHVFRVFLLLRRAKRPLSQEIPVIYGLLTTNDLQQAKDRSGGKLGNKGDECAIDAIKMAKF